MTEQIKKSTSRHNRRTKLRKGLRTASAALALASSGSFLASAEAAQPLRADGLPAEKALSTAEINPSQLPGKVEVTKSTQEMLAESTVKLVSNNGRELDDWCSGVKVMIGGQDYILTAAHCFSQLTGSFDGHFKVNGSRAMNYISAAGNLSFSIVDGSEASASAPMGDFDYAIANVTGISIDTNNVDLALLQVQATVPPPSNPDKGGPPYTGRTYDEIPAINVYTLDSNRALELKPGDQVAQYGIPQSSGNSGVLATGTYLGKISQNTYNTITPQMYQDYVVGLNAPNAQSDECEFGSSGSGALTQQGYLMILSMRNDPNSPYDIGVEKQRYLEEDNENLTDEQVKFNIQSDRRDWAAALGVKLDSFTTICGYTVPQESTYKDLVQGFNEPAPVNNK
jgi:hypothetical protein